jgi:hypothetical protein
MSEFLSENWAELCLAFLLLADTVVSLTPSTKDDRILGYIRLLFEAVIGDRADKSKKKS